MLYLKKTPEPCGAGVSAWWPDLMLIPPGGGGEKEATAPKMEAPGTFQPGHCSPLARVGQRVLKEAPITWEPQLFRLLEGMKKALPSEGRREKASGRQT